MLSLRELYTVAISYKNTPEQFYKIIDISVKIYPASPVANLNAAAAAIERATHRQPAAICKWLPMKRLPTRTAVEPTSCCATTPTKASAC